MTRKPRNTGPSRPWNQATAMLPRWRSKDGIGNSNVGSGRKGQARRARWRQALELKAEEQKISVKAVQRLPPLLTGRQEGLNLRVGRLAQETQGAEAGRHFLHPEHKIHLVPQKTFFAE